MTEDEMVGWHHWLDGHEFEQALGVGDGQEAWCAAVHGVTKNRTWLSNWTELNWNELNNNCYYLSTFCGPDPIGTLIFKAPSVLGGLSSPSPCHWGVKRSGQDSSAGRSQDILSPRSHDPGTQVLNIVTPSHPGHFLCNHSRTWVCVFSL